jgi:ArsR family transcriptional regulator, arsenate/arsenite/antimonite-responsive transcriptional repressor
VIETFTNTTKSLSDSNRVRVLMALRNRELCVCRLIELLQLAPSTVSKHLAILKQAGLIEGRKEGRWMLYRLPDDKGSNAWKTLALVFQSLENSPEVSVDQKRISEIVDIDIAELTQVYKK